MKKHLITFVTGILLTLRVQAKETTIDRFAQLYPVSNCKSLPKTQKAACILNVYNSVKGAPKNFTPEEKLTDEIIELLKKSNKQTVKTAGKCLKTKECKAAGQRRCNVECLKCRKSCF